MPRLTAETFRHLGRSHLGLPPADVLSGLDHLAEDLDSPFATCTYLTCQPVSGICEFASAGHLPPVVARTDGTAELIDPPPGPQLGIGGSTFTTHRLVLTAGSRLLLCADGLVETRTDPSTNGSNSFGHSSPAPRRTWKTPAISSWSSCATRAHATTSPSSSPACHLARPARPGDSDMGGKPDHGQPSGTADHRHRTR
ncbi:PP2C family protein-serine/threonine phosphatase [Streptomyces lancefieldiae]|uniref:PP2C family protein-serine/threonine phosphatase n=1 Tax=Streptomyces lancefieldiae TaxID=3075520 RepID=A0ABU3AXY5_9ACTN|nr:PP2C family protein-serine/threonine phosphatase [Streptomyces sp. DSM 40712]MDT0615038.1 PP2C family protein-serine/threonine phosphatase [Streptomyces sp. DSM 40712]